MKPLIVPGIIAKTQGELDEMLGKVKGRAKRIMLDVMDGEFVPNTSLNFDFTVPDGFEYEAHLMTAKPLEWLEKNGNKVDIAILQAETLDDIGAAVDYVKGKGLKVTLALNPETKLDVVRPYLGKVDTVLILTVDPGSFCVEFLPGPLKKVKRLREIDPSIPIEVDGCMDPDNVRQAKEAGANIFASGSYILKSSDVEKAIKELEEAAL